MIEFAFFCGKTLVVALAVAWVLRSAGSAVADTIVAKFQAASVFNKGQFDIQKQSDEHRQQLAMQFNEHLVKQHAQLEAQTKGVQPPHLVNSFIN